MVREAALPAGDRAGGARGRHEQVRSSSHGFLLFIYFFYFFYFFLFGSEASPGVQVPGHAHVRHLGPAEDRHEGRGAPARPRPAPRKSESEKWKRGNGVLRKGQHSWNISVTKIARMDPKVVEESSMECPSQGIFFGP